VKCKYNALFIYHGPISYEIPKVTRRLEPRFVAYVCLETKWSNLTDL